MNGKKFEKIRQDISLAKCIEQISTEPAQEFSETPSLFRNRIKESSQEIDRERQAIELEFSLLKEPIFSPLEQVLYPDPLSSEAEKILSLKLKILKELDNSQVKTERILGANKNAFSEKKAELHRKFLEFKGG